MYGDSGFNVAGLAWVGTVCSSDNKYSINENLGVSSTAFVRQETNSLKLIQVKISILTSWICRLRLTRLDTSKFKKSNTIKKTKFFSCFSFESIKSGIWSRWIGQFSVMCQQQLYYGRRRCLAIFKLFNASIHNQGKYSQVIFEFSLISPSHQYC